MTIKKNITYSREEYYRYNNGEIISLNEQLDIHIQECERIKKIIQKLQNDCCHEYLLYCDGGYEDCYLCKKCGHKTYK